MNNLIDKSEKNKNEIPIVLVCNDFSFQKKCSFGSKKWNECTTMTNLVNEMQFNNNLSYHIKL